MDYTIECNDPICVLISEIKLIAIKTNKLTKKYGNSLAVNGVSLTVNVGEVFALLGPNGAGKTTTVEILEGHRTKTSGEVKVLGMDPSNGSTEFRSRVGIVLQETGIEQYLTAYEILEQFTNFYKTPRKISDLLEMTGLTEEKDKRVKKLSGGQKRRLDVAIGLCGNPDLLFLDEPTTGFDPSARRTFWDMIKKLKTDGTTVVLTTHYMEEAEYLADTVALMNHGELITQGSLSDLRISHNKTFITFKTDEPQLQLPKDIKEIAVMSEGAVSISTENPTAVLSELTGWAISQGIELSNLEVSRQNLEDIYLGILK
ncbi:MAG TPA: ABC transporter ATP-binding protein [SAR202 cluster bacterium]|jgi:ABC-2 type transport system ATP-binding protein|nr:ABC transporter ATP-binding protein [SAR202 cluster bacterium]|tara:strand:- start:7548 stop:8492 length:945 start_codon:yes stop_codon:yes gene_type:complete